MRLKEYAWLIIVVLAVGCSKGTEKGSVHGQVTLDGQPLTAGIIRFVPADGKSATADAAVSEGKFSVLVPPGAKKVEITAPKVVGKRKAYQTADSPTIDVIEELLPARYNVQSELTLEVQAGEQEPPPFELKSK